MNDPTATELDEKRVDLVESLSSEWIKLPMAAIREVGPAAQTLGGILKLTNRETFAAASVIANRARLPLPTVRRHLTILNDAGWIINRGRQQTRSGRPRRTCTISITERALVAAKREYGVLPWWACYAPRNFPRLQWSGRAILSVIMARLMAINAAAERQEFEAGDLWETIENWNADERFRFSLAALERLTGMERETIIAEKRALHRSRIVKWIRGAKKTDGTQEPDYLVPNEDFHAVIRPAPGRMNMCTIDWIT